MPPLNCLVFNAKKITNGGNDPHCACITELDVLVISRRIVPRFLDLTPEEVGPNGKKIHRNMALRSDMDTNLTDHHRPFFAQVNDIFQSAQQVGRVVEKEYGGTSLTIACQVRSIQLLSDCGMN